MQRQMDEIRAERRRQVEDEGYSDTHDDRHSGGELVRAAVCYLRHGAAGAPVPDRWPFEPAAWRPGDERRSAVKAGALYLAEFERLRRAEGDAEQLGNAVWCARACAEEVERLDEQAAVESLAAGAELGRRLSRLWARQAEWSQETFGTDAERGPAGALKHLAREAGEALRSPTDKAEYADCLLLVLDAARRAGLAAGELLDAAAVKLEVNRQREWPPPAAGDEPVEHVKPADADRKRADGLVTCLRGIAAQFERFGNFADGGDVRHAVKCVERLARMEPIPDADPVAPTAEQLANVIDLGT
ncbi:MAG TPA: dATP/dGTP pyrophosphohydrolase domain-containing protein [Humisphaera sp.]